jgi:response regulator RpfG family c-di-GMP phosphodiesterase
MQTPVTASLEAQPTLLFVDDERNILSALNRLFRPQGYRIFTAEGGPAALQIMERQAIDLVISDMRMPGMDGAQLLAHIAERWPDTTRMLLTGYADIQSTVSAINHGHIYRYISKPWDDNDIKLNVATAIEQKKLVEEKRRLEALTKQQNAELHALNEQLETKVRQRTEQLQHAHQNLIDSYHASLHVFSGLIELREGRAPGHAKRVAERCAQLARHLQLTEAFTQTLYNAALLHDIGTLGFDSALPQKSFESLTLSERSEYIKHPDIAAALLMHMEPLHEAVPIIKAHREHWDGSGYPEGLKDQEIPLGARILCLINDYDKLQLGLLTKQTMTPLHARTFLERNKRRRYDPQLVDAFLALPEPDHFPKLGLAVSVLQLREGMVLSRELTTPDGILLLAKGAIINARVISTLAKLEKAVGTPLAIYVTQS